MLSTIVAVALVWYLLPKPWRVRKEAARVDRELARTKSGVPGPRGRSFLGLCTNCGDISFTLPFRDALGRTYCSSWCMSFIAGAGKGFCQRCIQETSDESSGDVSTTWSVGRHFGTPSKPCSQCGSVVQQVRFVVLFIPLLRLERYRVLPMDRAHFWSRKLYDQDEEAS